MSEHFDFIVVGIRIWRQRVRAAAQREGLPRSRPGKGAPLSTGRLPGDELGPQTLDVDAARGSAWLLPDVLLRARDHPSRGGSGRRLPHLRKHAADSDGVVLPRGVVEPPGRLGTGARAALSNRAAHARLGAKPEVDDGRPRARRKSRRTSVARSTTTWRTWACSSESPGESVPDPYFGGEGPERTGCIHCGACMTGCRPGAKNTLDKNYLYLAEKRGAKFAPRRRSRR